MARPTVLDRVMIFVDGTNLFHRLAAPKLRLKGGLSRFLAYQARGSAGTANIIRKYLYTSEPHLTKATEVHGIDAFDGIRVINGLAIPTKDGNFREKGVDALLVADLIYHAAAKNLTFAVIVSVDQDFAYAIKRVEDFGCRTSVLGVCAEVPEQLRTACDGFREVSGDQMIAGGYAERY